MSGAPSAMLSYYHRCLLEKLQTVQDYKEVRGKLIADSLTSAVVKLKASVNVLLVAVPGQGAEDSITEELIDSLRINLATAQSEWKTEAGEVSMHTVLKHMGNGRWQSFNEMYDGEDNVVIFEVTKLMEDCLTLVENIKAVLPKARAEVLVARAPVLVAPAGAGKAGASMHALLRQLDALK
jgi:hypothetical protein